MIIDNTEIEIFGVYDRGIPNQERIVLRTHSDTDLSKYFLILGFSAENPNRIFPVTDQFLWLGNVVIAKDSWVFIYTANGIPTVTRENFTGDPVHTIFWNKENVIFGDKNLTTALGSIGNLYIAGTQNKSVTDLKKDNITQIEK